MDDYLLAQFSELEWAHWWFVGRRAITADVLARWLPPTTEERRICDLGCGAGAMLPMLARFGQVEAIDTSPAAIEFCRRQFPTMDLRVGRVPEALPERSSTDLITAFDVIEHIEDDVAAVQAIAGSLRPGGLFACTVPAYQWLWNAHDDLNHHFRRYTRPRLGRVLEAGGLRVEWASYYNTALLPAVAAVRLGQRLFQPRRPPSSDLDLRVGRLNGVLARLFASERRVLRRMRLPAGVSIIAIARRPA